MSAKTCPHCGQPIFSPLPIFFDGNDVVNGTLGVRLHFTPDEASILYLLTKRYPKRTTLDAIIFHLWARLGRDEPEMPRNIVNVHLSRMRSRLTKLRLVIVNEHNTGYKIRNADEVAEERGADTARRKAIVQAFAAGVHIDLIYERYNTDAAEVASLMASTKTRRPPGFNRRTQSVNLPEHT